MPKYIVLHAVFLFISAVTFLLCDQVVHASKILLSRKKLWETPRLTRLSSATKTDPVSPEEQYHKTNDINWRPEDAPAALTSLVGATDRLRAVHDDRAIFLDIYIVVTAKVVKLVQASMDTRISNGFLDPFWLSELTGRFAEEALVALLGSLEGRAITPAPWRLANHLAVQRALTPAQSALLGINAHINYDLPLVLYEFLISDERHTTPDQMAKYKLDYFRVNHLLRTCVQPVVDILIERYDCGMTKFCSSLPGGRKLIAIFAMEVIKQWRRHVWRESMRLLKAHRKGHKGRIERIVRRLDKRSGFLAQCIASPQLISGRSFDGRGTCCTPALFGTSPQAWPGVVPGSSNIRSITDLVLSGDMISRQDNVEYVKFDN